MKNKSPLISVIMPAYNAEKYIEQAVASILNQTHKNLELIIINDCSTDKTGTIAEQQAKKDKRVRVFHNQKNSKEWFCRNLGLEKATGDYITWLDADDISPPERLEKQLAYLNKNKKADMVGADCIIIDGAGKKAKEQLQWLTDIIQTMPRVNDHGFNIGAICSSFLFKKSILKKIKKPYFKPTAIGLDQDFLFRLMEKKVQIFNMPDRLYYYRRHDEQTTASHYWMFLHVSLARYGAAGRRELGFDVLTQLLKKYNFIDKNNIVSALIGCAKIRKLYYHKIFLVEWLNYYFVFNYNHIKLLFVFVFYHPLIFLFQFLSAEFFKVIARFFDLVARLFWLIASFCRSPMHTLSRIYIKKLPWLHKPWRKFKKIILRKQ